LKTGPKRQPKPCIGLQTFTDCAFRRTCFDIDFLKKLGGVNAVIPGVDGPPEGTEDLAPPALHATGKVQHAKDPACRFRMPEPKVYEDVAMAVARGGELRSLDNVCCTLRADVQIDQTNMARLCYQKPLDNARRRGDDPKLPRLTTSHAWPKPRCQKRSWTPSFRRTTASTAANSSPCGTWALKRHIDEAAPHAPLEQWCLSPQNGFSSTALGNGIAVKVQLARMRLVVETAQEVWG